MNAATKPSLLEPDEALDAYFQSLLTAVNGDGDAESAQMSPATPGMDDPPADRLAAEAVPPVDAPAVAPDAATDEEDSGFDDVPDAPYWVTDPCACLQFQFSGIKLALPYLKIRGLLSFPAELPMPETDALPWYLGSMTLPGAGTLRIVDIGQIILPPGRSYTAQTPERVLVLEQQRWGIACAGGLKMLEIRPHQVRWRTASGKRYWLAGTLKTRASALLDVDGLIQFLDWQWDQYTT